MLFSAFPAPLRDTVANKSGQDHFSILDKGYLKLCPIVTQERKEDDNHPKKLLCFDIVKLSNKKRKYIRRHADTLSAEEVAGRLGVPLRVVRKALNGSDRVLSAEKERWLEKAFIALLLLYLFLAPHLFLRTIYNYANLPQTAFVQTGALLLVALALAGWTLTGRGQLRLPKLLLPMGLFLGWAAYRHFTALNLYEGRQTLLHWLAVVAIFILSANIFRDPQRKKWLLGTLFLSGSVTALLGIAQHLFQFSWVPQVVPPAATFANKNIAAQHMVLTIPLGFSLLLTLRSGWVRWGIPALTGLMGTFLFYSTARAAWLATAAAGLVFAVLLFVEWRRTGNRGLRLPIPPLLIALVIPLLLMNLGPGGFHFGIGKVSEHAASVVAPREDGAGEKTVISSLGIRLAVWRNTLEMVKDHPLAGVGLRNHKIFYPYYHRKAVVETISEKLNLRLSHTHNDYVQLTAELGLTGLALWIWGCLLAMLTGLRRIDPPASREERSLSMAIIASLGGILACALFSFPFGRAIPPLLVMVLLGALVADRPQEGQPGSRPSGEATLKRRCLAGLAAAGAFLALAGLVVFYAHEIQADREYGRVQYAESKKNWNGVLAAGRQALAHSPGKKRILFHMGRSYIETGRTEMGIAAIREALKDYPANANGWINLAVALQRTRRYPEALQAYDRAEELAPGYADIHFNKGVIRILQKNWGEAIPHLETAIALAPDRAPYHFNLAVAEKESGHYTTAAAALEKALELSPGWAIAHKNLAILYQQHLGKTEAGIRHFRRAIELDPNIPEGDKIRALLAETKDKK
jgi:tetratricopeptide (TPR) repeat protein